MKVASLFTGAGGMDLGLHLAGHDILLQVESDPHARQLLRKRFPGVRLEHDVAQLAQLPPDTELLAAGFPCVDVSTAGLRGGLEAEEGSGAVRHVFRLLEVARRDHRPIPWVLLENVPGLLKRPPGGGEPPVAEVCSALERLGYNWAQRTVCTAAFGIPNKRRRVFILAALHADPRDILLARGRARCAGDCQQERPGGPCVVCFQEELKRAVDEDGIEGRMVAVDLGDAQSGGGVEEIPCLKSNNGSQIMLMQDSYNLGMLPLCEGERLQGFNPGFSEPCYPLRPPGIHAHREPVLGPKDEDARASMRWALLSNAVSVPVARWLGDLLMYPHRFKYLKATGDMPMGVVEVDEYFSHQEGLVQDGLPGVRQHLSVEGAPPGGAAHVRPTPGEPVPPGDLPSGPLLDKVQRALAAMDGSDGRGWPNAAWFIKGEGRYRAEACEYPENHPYSPLSSFLLVKPRKLPQGLERQRLTTYLRRLVNEGFDVTRTLQVLEHCSKDIHEISLVRTEKLTARVGNLVWAKLPGYPWWPAEEVLPHVIPDWLFEGCRQEDAAHRPAAGGPAEAPEARIQGAAEDEAARQAIQEFVGPAPEEVAGAVTRLAGRRAEAPPEVSARAAAVDGDAALARQLQAAELERGLRRRNERPAGAAAPVAAPPGGAAGEGADQRYVRDLTRPPRRAAVALGGLGGLGGAARRGAVPFPHDPEAVRADGQPRGVAPHEESRGATTQRYPPAAALAPAVHGRAGPVQRAEGTRFVIFFGDGKTAYVKDADVIDFDSNVTEKTVQASIYGLATKAFYKAVEEAKQALRLRQLQMDEGLRGSAQFAIAGSRHRAAVQSAAKVAATKNIPDCGECFACQADGRVRRRCLRTKMIAGFYGGHSGAGVARLGHNAKGARLNVHWPLMGRNYACTVIAFNGLKYEHTLYYDDEEVETVALWHASQEVELLNAQDDFPAALARALAKKTAAEAEADAARAAREEQARQRVADERAREEAQTAQEDRFRTHLSEFEQTRLNNMERNRAVLADLLAGKQPLLLGGPVANAGTEAVEAVEADEVSDAAQAGPKKRRTGAGPSDRELEDEPEDEPEDELEGNYGDHYPGCPKCADDTYGGQLGCRKCFKDLPPAQQARINAKRARFGARELKAKP